MRCPVLLAFLCAILTCASFAVRAAPSQADAEHVVAASHAPASELDEHDRKLLDAMSEASTEGHPDLRGLFAGMRAFYRGDYQEALEQFRKGARYAGKQSQLTIGLMYLHGHGVDKDLASACAWLAVAAERGYPRYEATRKEVCSSLNRQQHMRALEVLRQLLPEYGDDVAVPRMRVALRHGMQQSVTGSMLGTDHGVTRIYPGDRAGACGGLRLQIGNIVVPKQGCGVYASELWRPDKYYAARAPSEHGTVTVGELDEVRKSEVERSNKLDQDAQSPAAASDVD